MTVSAPDRAHACALPGSPLAAVSQGLDACVHCGFCLQACPTYVNLDDENDSPRGRLVLMRRMLDGELAVDDPDASTHIDRCLGCRACETACPSGVPYGELLEATRATMLPKRGLPFVARVILTVFAHRPLLSAALAAARITRALHIPHVLARILPSRLAFPFAMLASTSPSRSGLDTPTGRPRGTSAHSRPNPHDPSNPSNPHQAVRSHAPTLTGDATTSSAIIARVSSDLTSSTPTTSAATTTLLLEGCVMRGLFAHVNDATVRVLAANGCSTADAPGQTCCGALHVHAGDLERARELARANVDAFDRGLTDTGASYIAVNAAGCGAMLKGYGHLLHDDAAYAARADRVSAATRDISELLAERFAVGGAARGGAVPLRITHDPPCHQMHAQRVVKQPIAVLNAIPGLELVPLEDADQCCGSAGIYNLIEPDVSDVVLEPKLDRIIDTSAAIVATGNPGCMMQLGAGLLLRGATARVAHPVELLDLSYRNYDATRSSESSADARAGRA